MNGSLSTKIELVRKKMITVGTIKGLTAPETIQLSQELDQLLNQLIKKA